MFFAPTSTLYACCCQPRCIALTGCACSVAQELLILANGEANSGRRAWWGHTMQMTPWPSRAHEAGERRMYGRWDSYCTARAESSLLSQRQAVSAMCTTRNP
jgi:hypothetical protein